MSKIRVRAARKEDLAQREALRQATTSELREIYRPIAQGIECKAEPTGIVVAVTDNRVVGMAEYVFRKTDVYVQGIAVEKKYRRDGVCRALVGRVEEVALRAGFSAMTLCAIEETGNVAIFEKMGFKTKKRSTASGHADPGGATVFQIDMERKIG